MSPSRLPCLCLLALVPPFAAAEANAQSGANAGSQPPPLSRPPAPEKKGQFQKIDAATLAPVLAGGTPDGLGGTVRGYLLRAMPDPLYEASPGWGHQRREVRGIKWADGNPLKPEVVRGAKNQGVWRKVRISASNPAESLVVDIRNFRDAEPGRKTFTVFLAMNARVDFTQQRWEAGVKLYDGSIRARFRARVNLDAELTSRFGTGPLLLPDLAIRLRVVRANLEIDQIVFEHIAGIGGDAAKLIGKALQDWLKEARPSMEKDLLAKANAAIVKAADTKEVRIGIVTLLKNHK